MTRRRHRSTIGQARRFMYRGASFLGDVQAAENGPGAYVRRRVRARSYARGAGLLRRLWRITRL